MRVLALCVVLLVAVLTLAGSAAAGEPPSGTSTEVHVITMGPGDGLYTRAGHLALMVATLLDGKPVATRIYNYGATDWDNPWMVTDFLTGRLTFFLSSPGSLDDAVRTYGVGQKRTVYRQKLALTAAQTQDLVARLEQGVKPENRAYRYHHVEAICTTKARDLIDQVVGGAIREQLSGEPSDATIQQDVQLAFSGHRGPSIAADLLFGWRHYRPVDLYYGLYHPDRMREALQRVHVPDPQGGSDPVPLAGPPIKLGERIGPPLNLRPSHSTFWLAIFAAVVLLALGADAYRQLPNQTRIAGAWVALWALPVGLLGLLIAGLMTFSAVPELHDNELILSFPPTDLWLLGLSVRWMVGREVRLRLLRWYVLGRVVVGLFCLAAIATGLFIQRPVILPMLSLAFSLGLWLMLRRAEAPRQPATAPPAAAS